MKDKELEAIKLAILQELDGLELYEAVLPKLIRIYLAGKTAGLKEARAILTES